MVEPSDGELLTIFYEPFRAFQGAAAGARAVWDAALVAAREAIRDAAPPLNSELSFHGGAGPFVDKGMEGYIEGFHDAFVVVDSMTQPRSDDD